MPRADRPACLPSEDRPAGAGAPGRRRDGWRGRSRVGEQLAGGDVLDDEQRPPEGEARLLSGATARSATEPRAASASRTARDQAPRTRRARARRRRRDPALPRLGVRCFSRMHAPRATATIAAVAPRVWSERPTGTPHRAAMSGIVRRSISAGEAGIGAVAAEQGDAWRARVPGDGDGLVDLVDTGHARGHDERPAACAAAARMRAWSTSSNEAILSTGHVQVDEEVDRGRRRTATRRSRYRRPSPPAGGGVPLPGRHGLGVEVVQRAAVPQGAAGDAERLLRPSRSSSCRAGRSGP